MITRLGPKQDKSVPTDLLLEKIIFGIWFGLVFKKWETDIITLFFASNQIFEWDDIFCGKIIKIKNILEANLQQQEYLCNEYLNITFTEDEVK